MTRIPLLTSCAALALAASATAQGITPLVVGTEAPDFSGVAATSAGVNAKPFRLSEQKGRTVVLAFFFKARTRG